MGTVWRKTVVTRFINIQMQLISYQPFVSI